jgi:hypothetical protein
MSSIFNNVRVLGNLDVRGTTTSIDSTIVNIADNFLYLNKDLSNGTSSGGIVINYDASGLTENIVDGITTSGFKVSSSGIQLVIGDFIQVSDAGKSENNGLYQITNIIIDSQTLLVTIDVTASGSGTSVPLIDFVQTGFTTDSNDTSANINKVSISVIQATSNGVLQFGSGNSISTLTMNDVMGGVNLTNYLKLTGELGGQTVIGGTESGNHLTLQPNISDTTGSVIIANSIVNATSKDSGALVVDAGGLGVDLNIFAGGSITTSTGFISNNLDTIPYGMLSVGNSASDINIGGYNSSQINIGTSSTPNLNVNLGNALGIVKIEGLPKYLIQNINFEGDINPTVTNLQPVTRFTGNDNFTYNLPPMNLTEDGVLLTFYKSSNSGVVTIEANVGNTGLIDGGTISLINQYDRISIMYMHSDLRWIIV